jgi:hypothetical protein
MRRRRQIKADQKLADDARLLRAWRRWHREQLEEVLSGPHGAAVAQVVDFLKRLGPQSAPALIEIVRAQDWQRVDRDVRFVLLHEINGAIMKLREKNGLAPIDDALPHEKATGFLVIRALLA